MLVKTHSGLSLLEVLLSLMLLSVALLGTDAMEAIAQSKIREAYFFSMAENQMEFIAERLVALNSYEGFETVYKNWNLQNGCVLPNGTGDISGAYPHYTITLYWGHNPHSCFQTRLGQSGCLREKLNVEA